MRALAPNHPRAQLACAQIPTHGRCPHDRCPHDGPSRPVSSPASSRPPSRNPFSRAPPRDPFLATVSWRPPSHDRPIQAAAIQTAAPATVAYATTQFGADQPDPHPTVVEVEGGTGASGGVRRTADSRCRRASTAGAAGAPAGRRRAPLQGGVAAGRPRLRSVRAMMHTTRKAHPRQPAHPGVGSDASTACCSPRSTADRGVWRRPAAVLDPRTGGDAS
jgi:hypothetical protein